MDLTKRQLYALSRQIQKRKVRYRYPMQAFFASLHGAKFPSLDEILGKATSDVSEFDAETDKLLEKRAFERLKEMQNGR